VDDARLQFDRARVLAEDLASSDPRNLAVAECLRDVYLGLGELILRDEHAWDATVPFRSALKQAKAIMAAEPARAGARHGLAEAYQRLGRALDTAGDRAEAKECFRTMQELAERWVDDEPKSAPARDMLGSSYLRLARIQRNSNEPVEAGVAYRQAIAIARVLWTAEPKDIVYKTHLAHAMLDSASFSIDLHTYGEARPLLVESVRLHQELADADPEDREAQVWLVHAHYHLGRLERNEEHFARAEEVFRQALDHLQRLDREGKLEGRPAFKVTHMRVLKQQVSFCAAAPKVLEDLSVARSQPPDVTIRLLRFRAKRLAELGRYLELAATAEMLCAFEEGDSEEQYHLAGALAMCVPFLENGRSTGQKGGDRSDLHQRCKDRAVAAVARAIERGYHDAKRLEDDLDLVSIRNHPGFRALVEQARSHQTPREVRDPTR
jgi:tetratricopeptide (TPR) repeat protein